MKQDWKPMAPAYTATQGQFSFLIALGRQMERALELEKDGSAPEWLSDALGVLQNALEGISGQPVGTPDASDSDDGGDDIPFDVAPSRLGGVMGPRGARQRGGSDTSVSPPLRLNIPQEARGTHFQCNRIEGQPLKQQPKATKPKPGRVPRGTSKKGKRSGKAR